MVLRVWRFITLLLAALALTMESAHVLELPQKMQYDAQMYSAVNTTLYRYFAVVGGMYQVSSIVAAVLLVFLVHKRKPSFGWTLAGALCLLLAFGIWLAVVAPVSREVTAAFPRGTGIGASALDATAHPLGIRARCGLHRAVRRTLCTCALGVGRDAEGTCCGSLQRQVPQEQRLAGREGCL